MHRRNCFVAAFLVAQACRGIALGDAPWAKPGAGPGEPSLVLPIDVEALKADWEVIRKPSVVKDDLLGREVIETTGRQLAILRSKKPVSGDYRIEVLVRLPDPNHPPFSYFTVRTGIRMRNNVELPAYGLSLSRYRYTERGHAVRGYVGEGRHWQQPHRDPGEPDPWGRGLIVTERFPANKISPLWEPDFRIPIENDLAKTPLAKDVWHRIQIVVRSDRVAMFDNGLLVAADENRVKSDGLVSLKLQGAVRVARLEVRPVGPESPRYVTAPLEFICNATGPVDPSSLPPVGKALVNGIPFQFPDRGGAKPDHVDIGESIFRHRLSRGGMNVSGPRYTWPGPQQLDSARLQIRVPRHGYRRLWIIAASDGEPNSAPVITARFYKPLKSWPLDSTASVPEFTATSQAEGARRLEITMKDGKPGSLWLLPLEIDTAALVSDFREEPALSLELTKEVKDFRAFPDPMNYGSYQGGLPSAVRLYALTLEKAPVTFIASGTRNGNVYPYPEQPVWETRLANQIDKDCTAEIRYEVTSPDGKITTGQDRVVVPADLTRRVEFRPPFDVYGRHKVRTSVTVGDETQSRDAWFLALPPDTRRANGRTSRWGLWCWNGGHGTNPNSEENLQILRAVGSLIGGHIKQKERAKWGIAPGATLAERGTPKWAFEDPYDPEEYQKFSDEFGQRVAGYLKDTPDLAYVSMFAEHSISLRVTHGNPPYVFGQGNWFEYDDAEKASIRAHLIAAKAAYEGIKKHAPKVKFLFGHCGPQFSIPFMREGYDKSFFDGYGLDAPQFERMPERPPRAVECNLMYYLKKEMQRGGYDPQTLKKEKKPVKELIHTESYYPSSHRLALGWRKSADSVVRTTVLSLAFGSDRFFACWTLHDCEGYWGSQHYGCIGIISRRPEYNPKPAAAAFATMTQVLDAVTYEGWVETGSRTVYCVRFKRRGANWTYAIWTIRGERPLTLQIKPLGRATPSLTMVDENGNETPLEIKDGKAQVTAGPTALWVKASNGTIDGIELGAPVHKEEPGPHYKLLADLGTADWTDSAEPYPSYAENNWDVVRTPGEYTFERVKPKDRGAPVLRVALKTLDKDKPLVSWYSTYTPPKPIPIPGKARALGIHANGNSGWGRLIYEVQDAKGEIFQSVGTKDDWNCDDVHSWGYFNFDGWRYMEFPLPSHSPGDNYREKDAVWWNASAEGIVDLPLSLTKIIVEMQSHQIYVDEMLPVPNPTIELDDLIAVYESAEMMTDKPVQIQRAAAGMPKTESTGEALPNPIAGLIETGVGAATEILKLYPPEQYFDGTRVHVSVKPVEGATEYQVWLSAYPDGRGAVALKKTDELEPLITRLKPDFPLYFFVTYTGADGKQSRPSKGRKVILKDEFPMK